MWQGEGGEGGGGDSGPADAPGARGVRDEREHVASQRFLLLNMKFENVMKT